MAHHLSLGKWDEYYPPDCWAFVSLISDQLSQCLNHRGPTVKECHLLRKKTQQPLLKIHLSLKYITYMEEMHNTQFGGFAGLDILTCFSGTGISSLFSTLSHCTALPSWVTSLRITELYLKRKGVAFPYAWIHILRLANGSLNSGWRLFIQDCPPELLKSDSFFF